MSSHFHDVEKQASALPPKEKAALALKLIGDLESSVDADAERLWIDEAERRYDAYRNGEQAAFSGDEVMTRARNRLK